jgi:hypothetical protein
MDLDALARLTGIIGITSVGVAVVAWIAGMIRQSIREAQLIAFQNTASRHQQWQADLARDPDLARVYSAGLAAPELLDEIDRIRFEALASSLFRNWEDEFLHYARGMVDDEIFAGRRNAFKIHMTQPGMRWYWQERRSHFTASFAKFVNLELNSLVLTTAERSLPAESTPSSEPKPGAAETIDASPVGCE